MYTHTFINTHKKTQDVLAKLGPTLRHVLSWDEIRCPSMVLYFSDFNLFYHLALANLSLYFFSFHAKIHHVFKIHPCPERMLLRCPWRCFSSCKWAGTAARYSALPRHKFSLQAAGWAITFTSAWNEIKLQTCTGWTRDEITWLQSKLNFKQQCGGVGGAEHSVPALLQTGGWYLAELKSSERVPGAGKKKWAWFPFTWACSRLVLFCNILLSKALFINYQKRLLLFLTKANGTWMMVLLLLVFNEHTQHLIFLEYVP